MIQVVRSENLGRFDNEWLNARYHFSFAGYHDDKRMGFGPLRVINDDTVRAGTGFDPHPHRNMEIITYVRSGAILHGDNLGNEGRTGAGDVQVMSAGTGIVHSERADDGDDTKLYQIWIQPRKTNVAPRWDQAVFPKAPANDALKLLVSGRAEDEGKGALHIHQDAAIYGGVLKAGAKMTHASRGTTGAYILVPRGTITVNGVTLNPGDGAEVRGEDTLQIVVEDQEAEILIIEV